jgi:hypothetical protein
MKINLQLKPVTKTQNRNVWLANCYFASHRLTISTYINDARNLL